MEAIKQKDIEKLSLEEVDRLIEKYSYVERELINENRFQYYVPYDGSISKERRDVLRLFLKEEDIPVKMDGQLDIHLCEDDIIGNFSGNQSGKSTVAAIEDFIAITGELPDALKGIYPKSKIAADWPFDVRVVAVNEGQLLNTVIPTYQKWAPKKFLKNGKWEDSFTSREWRLNLYRDVSGKHPIGSIEFKTNEQKVRTFQGPPKHKVTYDEEPNKAIRDENTLRFMTASQLREMYACTPTSGLSWLSDLFLDEEDEGKNNRSIRRFQLCSASNPETKIETLKSICENIAIGRKPEEIDEEDYNTLKMRLLGEFVSLSGLVYGKLFNKKLHVIKPFFEYLNQAQKEEYLCLSGWDPHSVTPTAGIFILVDREGVCYVDRCYSRGAETDIIKEDFHRIVKDNGYRMGWSVADKSSNSSMVAFGGRNIFQEISRGNKAIPGLRESIKFEGSIKAGIDDIKKRLKLTPPTFYIVDRPENRELIKTFRTMERDTYANEEAMGPKDRIKEGRHHFHAALRYLFQFRINWYPKVIYTPELVMSDEEALW